MKRFFIWLPAGLLTFTLCITANYLWPGEQTVSTSSARETVSVCDIARDPASFYDKRLRVKANMSIGENGLVFLSDPACGAEAFNVVCAPGYESCENVLLFLEELPAALNSRTPEISFHGKALPSPPIDRGGPLVTILMIDETRRIDWKGYEGWENFDICERRREMVDPRSGFGCGHGSGNGSDVSIRYRD